MNALSIPIGMLWEGREVLRQITIEWKCFDLNTIDLKGMLLRQMKLDFWLPIASREAFFKGNE